ncbi:MAG: cysteine protease StiP family protein [Desulfotomaculum sp.]|nr:cysteine protease StiP family protein [Desulfotomaculum sp.]MCL0080976.1 cysteine protease StiP family protein [Peptococcaceae bacterium]
MFSNIPVITAPAPIGSYSPDDVVFLLKDIGDYVQEQGNLEREQAMQSGRHYSEMLPIEYRPPGNYIDLFHRSLQSGAVRIALATALVARQIFEKDGPKTVLVSLARAGTPVGILIKRYIQHFYQQNLAHYSISIIRDRGIDQNALLYLLQQHPGDKIRFIDGWTGKGAITKELITAMAAFKQKYGVALNAELAVLADPGYCAHIFGTRDDFLIPSACLNATVCGLVSRTFYRPDVIAPTDFHGAKYYRNLASEDLSRLFIEQIVTHFAAVDQEASRIIKAQPAIGLDNAPTWSGLKEITTIKKEFNIDNINFIKPGVGETTRVLLRRVPWKILVKNSGNPDLEHVLLLAKERNVPVEEYSQMTYSCCGLIKAMKN